MNDFLLWKSVKIAALCLYACSFGVALADRESKRARAILNWISGVGFVLLWFSGYGMLKSSAFSMSEEWIYHGQLLSALSLLYLTSRHPDFSSQRTTLMSAVCFFSAVISMVLKDSTALWSKAILLVFLIDFVYWIFRRGGLREDEDADISWFLIVSKCETASLIVLFFIYMPLKYINNINLDQGTGWVGWVHGVFQVSFVLALLSLYLLNRLRFKQLILGILASLIPLGPIIFEKKYLLNENV